MLINVAVSIFAITMGIIYGLSFIYFDKLTSCLKKREKEKKYYKYIRIVFSWSLPIVAAFMMFILPGMLLSMFVGKDYILNTRGGIFDIYVFIAAPTFFITLFVLIKIGKLKIGKD